tara:strand:+ start:1048 stop:1356 length:309 start_codon:yes stop_codon:yes gene_type:complete
MAHFAEIKDGVVQRVIVAEQDFINSGIVGDSFNWIQTSYNHNFRKQFAGIGYYYDKATDVFIAPQPFSSWALDENNDWNPPTPKPDGNYAWKEDTQEWIEII